MRREPDRPLETVLDPNTWPSTEALVYAVPSPDGSLVAFGKATGSTHDARIQILEIDTGTVLADEPSGTSHYRPAWRPDSASFFYPAVADGKEVIQTNTYSHTVVGRLQESNAAMRIKEQEIVERRANPDGSVVETLSVRRPSMSDPNRLGDLQRISETVCKGKCQPETPAKPAVKP